MNQNLIHCILFAFQKPSASKALEHRHKIYYMYQNLKKVNCVLRIHLHDKVCYKSYSPLRKGATDIIARICIPIRVCYTFIFACKDIFEFCLGQFTAHHKEWYSTLVEDLIGASRLNFSIDCHGNVLLSL